MTNRILAASLVAIALAATLAFWPVADTPQAHESHDDATLDAPGPRAATGRSRWPVQDVQPDTTRAALRDQGFAVPDNLIEPRRFVPDDVSVAELGLVEGPEVPPDLGARPPLRVDPRRRNAE